MQNLTRTELAEIIGEKTLKVSDPIQLAREVAAYLNGVEKSVDLDSLMRDVMQYRMDKGIIEAVAVSAHELTPLVISDVKALLKEHFPDAKHFNIDSRIDPEVVGGIRIELPRENLDLSIRNKLNRFKRLVAEERN